MKKSKRHGILLDCLTEEFNITVKKDKHGTTHVYLDFNKKEKKDGTNKQYDKTN